MQRNGRNNMAEHRGGSGNFAEDREKASDAGRKGGQHTFYLDPVLKWPVHW